MEDEEEMENVMSTKELYQKYEKKKSHLKKHLLMNGKIVFKIYKQYKITNLGKFIEYLPLIIFAKSETVLMGLLCLQ